MTGLAYAGGILYASLWHTEHLSSCYQAKQGTIQRQVRVPAPGRLAVCPDGSLLVLSNGTVLRVAGEDVTAVHRHPPGHAHRHRAGCGRRYLRGQCRQVAERLRLLSRRATTSASSASAEGARASDAMIRLACWSRAASRWTAPASYGWRRRWIRPKRISAWDSKTGKLLNEFFGGSEYATYVAMDPKHEDEVYCHNVLWKVDLQKGTWAPKSTIWRATVANAGPEPHGTCGCGGPIHVFTAKNGHQYAWAWLSNYSNALYMRQGDTFIPLLCGINVLKGNQFVAWPPYPLFADNKTYPNGIYVWQDANNDQVMQANEISKLPLERSEGFATWVDADLNLYCSNGMIFRPAHFAKDGRPIYDFSKAEKLPVEVSVVDPQDGSTL